MSDVRSHYLRRSIQLPSLFADPIAMSPFASESIFVKRQAQKSTIIIPATDERFLAMTLVR